MGRVWDTSSMILSLRWVYSRSRSFKVTRSKKGQIKILSLRRIIRVFRSVFIKNDKMTLKHFLSGPNRTTFENHENAEIPANSLKNGHLRPSKCHKLSIFQDIDLKFCAHIHLRGFFHIYSFLEISKIVWFFFEKWYFYWFLFKILQFFKSQIAVWYHRSSSPFCWKSFGSISSAVCVTPFPVNLYFCLQPGKHDVTLTSFVVDISEVTSFQIDCFEGIEKFGDDPFVTSGDIAKICRNPWKQREKWSFLIFKEP